VLVELTMTEQRYRAVLEVQAGVPVTEVAERFGVSRQAVHRWVGWYRDEGLDGLSDRSHRPHAHPAQTGPEVVAAAGLAASLSARGPVQRPPSWSRPTRGDDGTSA
jgi:transposase-like protein